MGESVPGSRNHKLSASLGFREGACSVHTSRTLMLAELSMVLDKVPVAARPEDYVTVIVEENALGKPTQTTRRRTARRLTELYGLDLGLPFFRLLRTLWPSDAAARPMLAFLAASARDPLLREMTPFVISMAIGSEVSPDQINAHLTEKYPGRFQASTSLATSQRLASSWGQSGFLRGKLKKVRSRPVVTPEVVAFALALGFLCGLRGRLLTDSPWTRLLDRTNAEVVELVIEASRQGWLTYKAAGEVVEVTFPGLLKPPEGEAGRVPD